LKLQTPACITESYLEPFLRKKTLGKRNFGAQTFSKGLLFFGDETTLLEPFLKKKTLGKRNFGAISFLWG